MTVWTIGHSTHPWDEFVALLERHGIEALADVRRFPASRKHPQYNQEPMRQNLGAVTYVHLPELGGRRRMRADSHNTAWRNDSFRGYADYMETPEFAQAMDRFLELAAAKRTALMCAESVWWRCHRGLIADWLKVRGIEVLHIVGSGAPGEHPYTGAASVVDGRLSYAGPQEKLL
ncbi:MAG TPA: DUF488 domain-containing protein [Burkholderiales bacterium]|nr:DUF488 domain-containing protein [Burkholderiales bacterium]